MTCWFGVMEQPEQFQHYIKERYQVVSTIIGQAASGNPKEERCWDISSGGKLDWKGKKAQKLAVNLV